MRERVEQFAERLNRARLELEKVVLGQRALLEHTLLALVAGGNVLLEGVPGLGKTLLVRTLGQVLDLSFARCQFTPDLMPADILGTPLLETAPDGSRSLRFQPGPVFTHLLLADEVNRATPKTQAALLEAMQERQVTNGGVTYPLPRPFFVLATQNPLDMEGTYPLPEAQTDRFLIKLLVPFPGAADLADILEGTTGPGVVSPSTVLGGAELQEMQELAREVVAARDILEAIARLVRSTHPELPECQPETRRWVRFGASPRGAQAVLLMAKARALSQGRLHVALDDVKEVALPCLRHRLLPSYEAEAERVDSARILEPLLAGLRLGAA